MFQYKAQIANLSSPLVFGVSVATSHPTMLNFYSVVLQLKLREAGRRILPISVLCVTSCCHNAEWRCE